MYADGRDEIEEYFSDYMQGIDRDDKDSKEKYVRVPIDADVLKRLEKFEAKKQQDQDKERSK
jgi:hypothetical protein